jgi:hypothetical protein
VQHRLPSPQLLAGSAHKCSGPSSNLLETCAQVLGTIPYPPPPPPSPGPLLSTPPTATREYLKRKDETFRRLKPASLYEIVVDIHEDEPEAGAGAGAGGGGSGAAQVDALGNDISPFSATYEDSKVRQCYARWIVCIGESR